MKIKNYSLVNPGEALLFTALPDGSYEIRCPGCGAKVRMLAQGFQHRHMLHEGYCRWLTRREAMSAEAIGGGDMTC